jgi:hypothetical protein
MNLKTNLLSIIIAFTLVLTGAAYYGTGFASAEAGGTAFTDLPTSHWAYSSVQKMQAKGIVKGYPDGSFGPSKTVTYGEFIKMAVVAVKGTDDIANAKDATHWASGYYKYAIENGIFHSGQIAEKQLGSTIPRDDMALICANAANLSEVNMKEIADKIPDVDKTTRNEYQIAQAYAEGLITGYEDGSFHPYGTLTRAEASTVILRIIDKSARKVPDWAKEEKTETATETSDNTNWLTDKHGQYRWVNVRDYAKEDLDKERYGEPGWLMNLYYIPDKVKLYKAGELKGKFLGNNESNQYQKLEFDEFSARVVGIKDGKVIYGEDEGFESFFPAKGDMDVNTTIGILDYKDIDYFMFLGSSINYTYTEEEIDRSTPRIYPNPFK